ncbi:hypothetical protein SAMN04487939_10736 [Lysobacter sp. yr284]|nr:hypothetical protein SAMN04487939_10736 [Lysobacter sp. yr284]
MRDRANADRAGSAPVRMERACSARIGRWARGVWTQGLVRRISPMRSAPVRRRGARAIVLAVAAVCAALALPAQAQFDAAGQAVLMHQHQVHTGNVLSAEQGALNAGRAQAAPGKVAASSVWSQSLGALARGATAAAAAPDSALRFRRDPALSARVQGEQAGVALKGLSMTPAQMRERFDALLLRYGYARDDLGDVAAAYLAMAWEVANDRNAKDVPGGEAGLRKQLRRALLASPGLRTLSDAQKQELAERLAYAAMRHGVTYEVYRQTGARNDLVSLGERVRREVERQGLDLRRYELVGGQGLSARR